MIRTTVIAASLAIAFTPADAAQPLSVKVYNAGANSFNVNSTLVYGEKEAMVIDAGFSRAFWTIFDAHVASFISGFVLLEYGTGPVRGFAVMLIVGVICNLFTSTWASRHIFNVYLGRRRSAAETLSI